MKKFATIFTSMLLCLTMLIVYPAQLVASAADNGKKYISEVKVGMGETSEQASKELLDEGYTILADDKGSYADLNKDAGTGHIAKEGPNQKIVYLGYKTTDDASDAITDLAVMNMHGEYSFEDYNKMMDTQMDTQIKPFVNRFVATLNEYRANLNKPKDSVNYKRANYYKTLLNKLTDDDTGNKPLGDLLVNQTKYEMGDDAYNKLSDTEKKSRCDILTLLMQGSGEAVQLMETELTKASDSSDTTWLDRFKATSLEKLTEEVKKEHPDMTPSEINAELDKKYNDAARKIHDKWGYFNEVLINYDTAVKKAEEVVNSDAGKKEIELNENSTDQEVKGATVEMYKAEADMVKGGYAAEDITVHDYLEVTEYADGTLLDFFMRDRTEFDDEEIIRDLYPIVDTLSGGQLAGLDFLSIRDMILMAITDENGFKEVNMEDVQPASIYQDVNREIYERGGVALTDAAIRAKASSQEQVPGFELSTAGIVLWTCTAAAGLAAAGSAIAMACFNAHPDMIKLADTTKKIEDVTKFTFLKEPVVLTAKLNAISYYIAFDNNAQDAVGTVSKKTANYNKDVALSNKVSRSGYELVGWNTQADGRGTMFEPKGKVKNLTTTKGEIVKLYAVWKPLGASTTASIFSYGTGLIFAGAAILVLGIAAAVIYSVRKKKKEQQKE